ncbi:pentapeptide repeat-containing protein [Fodinicola feengrottensis]|uniref:pentapeptide repeat-containing protein n=1 Tax=Fodinicola feengrottensis TaxID=435914 RepID=UPI002442C9FB|nr:pentapeptide repeat-containing protein [Fodinicola feengrottensis]
MPESRELAELPYAPYLVAPDGELEQGDDYDTVHFQDVSFTDVKAGNTRFAESAFSSVDFGNGHFRRAKFNDVWIHTGQFVGTDLVETTWLDTEIITSVLAGAAMFDAELTRVSFFGCKNRVREPA